MSAFLLDSSVLPSLISTRVVTRKGAGTERASYILVCLFKRGESLLS